MNFFKERYSNIKLSLKKTPVIIKIDSIIYLLEIVLPFLVVLLPYIRIPYVNILGGDVLEVSILFVNKIDTFATIATVLVGIYFSLLTILLTIDSNSIISLLNRTTLKKITRQIGFAFFVSCFYMFSPLFEKFSVLIDLILLAYFVLIFLLSLRIGLYFFIIINTDVNNKLDKLKESDDMNKRMFRMLKKIYDEKENDK